MPVADGGEGAVECFVQAIGAVPVPVPVTGPYVAWYQDADDEWRI